MILLRGKRYSFKDEFTSVKAVGSLNTSICEPGPGTRVVTDTTNKLSISDGNLYFAGGNDANGDPICFLSKQIDRQPGTVIAFKIVLSTNRYMSVGLNDNTTASSAELTYEISPSIGAMEIFYPTSGYKRVSKAPAINTEYIMIIVLRTEGVFYFIKEGSNSVQFVYAIEHGTTSPLYAGIYSYSATCSCGFVRIKKTSWLPTPLLSDSFTADDATSNAARLSDGLGHAETTGLGSGGIATWSGASGAVQGNRLVIVRTVGDELASGNLVVGNWYLITATTANYFGTGRAVNHTFRASATTALDANNKVKLITLSTTNNYSAFSTTDIEITTKFQMTTGTQAGIVIGLNDSETSFILVYHDGAGNIKLEICEAGTYTTKNTTATTYVSDYELKVARRSNEIWVWYDNVLIGAWPTTTLSADEGTNLSGLKAGLFSTYEGNSFNDCVIYNVGTDGSYSILDRLIG